MSLKDLDDRWLPELARRADALVRKIPKGGEPLGPAPVVERLRRVDDRWTATGPLALLREVPQLGAVAIGALVLANGIALRSRVHPKPPVAAQQQQPTEAPETDEDGRLGPGVGDKVAIYVAESRAHLERVGSAQPDGAAVAVVMFSGYRTPAQVRDVVGPLQVRKIFFRVPLPLPQTIVQTSPVQDLVRDSKRAFARYAAIRKRQADELLRVAATIENDPAQKADQEKDAALALREVAVLKGTCRCVFAVVVRGRLRLLLDLLQVPGIRAIDSSGSGGMLEDFTFTALLPEEKSVVTGGNQSG
jgi:hypothetical protein